MRSRGERGLSWREKRLLALKTWLRKQLVSEVEVQDRKYKTWYVCENRLQAYRAVSLWVKEPGTMAWIEAETRLGDRFLDIGANVGIYTIAAAHRVGDMGRVYAVEPHKPNAVSLMRNILRNDLQRRVDVLTLPLAEQRIVAAFNYTSLEPSVTGSQLGSTFLDGHSRVFKPAASELCLGMSVDELISINAIQAPHLIKIDVDGIELNILKGMRILLASAERPRGIQVELNIGEHDGVVDFLASQGYKLDHRHFTIGGERRRMAGVNIADIAHNAIFVPANIDGKSE